MSSRKKSIHLFTIYEFKQGFCVYSKANLRIQTPCAFFLSQWQRVHRATGSATTSKGKFLPEDPGHTLHVNIDAARSRTGGGNEEVRGQRRKASIWRFADRPLRGVGSGEVGRWSRASG